MSHADQLTELTLEALHECAFGARERSALECLTKELELARLAGRIRDEIRDKVEKTQREYYLRQQLKAIKEELGETDEATVELEEYRAKITEKKLPEEAVKEAKARIAELEGRGRGFYTGSMGYLDRRGRMDLNILIRSMLVREHRLTFRTGAGIVADSQARREV